MKELRHLPCEIRASSDSRILTGHAVVWGALSHDLGGFKERFRKGAFNRYLTSGGDVAALYQHRDDQPLARMSAGTLKVWEDDIGLAFEMDVAPTTYGDDALISIRRKEVNGMSFGFSIDEAGEVLSIESGRRIREVIEAVLYEVSPVTFPAYAASTVSNRSLIERFEALEGSRKLNSYYLEKRLELLNKLLGKDSQ